METQREKYRRKKAAGICCRCQDPVVEGKARCAKHLHENKGQFGQYKWKSSPRAEYLRSMGHDV
jgi:predicted amidophosphoribosyltransferase